MSGRTVAIIQARMTSTRLPGKVLVDLAGAPVIDHVVERVRAAELIDEVAVATSIDASDDALAEHLEAVGVTMVRGSLDDVLGRYHGAAAALDAETIVRITGDCPLIDSAVIDTVVSGFRRAPEVDYCSNTLRRTYPLGMDTEVFSRAALERAHREARSDVAREHVTPYLYQHPDLFSLRSVEAPAWAHRPELRLTLDDPRDLEMIRRLMGEARRGADLHELLAALDRNPDIAEMNANVAHRHTEKPNSW